MPALKGNEEKFINGFKVDKENDDVFYSDEKHVYLTKKDLKPLISATTLIGLYCQPFDTFYWSSYKTCEKLMAKEDFAMIKPTLLSTKKWDDSMIEKYKLNRDEFIKTRQEIQQGYDTERIKSCERGTKIHAEAEELYYTKEQHDLQKFGLGGTFTCKKGYYKLDLDKGIYPELLLNWESKDGLLKLGGQADLIALDGNNLYIWDYKGLPLDTIIPTKEGFKMLSDINVGDKLFDKDGNLTTVLHKSEVHNNPCYRIKFDNSESIVADEDHRWLISFSRTGGSYVSTVMTTKELASYTKNLNRKNAFAIPKILNASPINTDDIDLPIDPYVLGAWLGDGSKNCGILTQAVGSKLFDEIKSRGYEVGENLIHSEYRQGTESRTVFGLRTLLGSLNLLYNKHIPDIYLRASFRQRLDLLRGYMDTDGYFHPVRKRFVMGTTSEQQARDIVRLVSTFGIKPTLFSVNKVCDGKKFPGFDVCFTTDLFNPFLIRNQNIELPTTKKKDYRVITSVEPTDLVPTQCLEVDSPSHTFCVTESMIVTHNTNKEIKKRSFYDSNTKSNIMLKYPLNNIQQANFWVYSLQLSLYAWILQQIRPDLVVKQLQLIHIDHNDKVTTYDCDYLKSDVERMLKHYYKTLKQSMSIDRDKPIQW